MMVGEKKQKRIDQIDGRTVLFLTLCACIVTFLTTSFLGHGCFSFLIFLILCWFGLYKQALGCFAVYLVAIVWLMIETKSIITYLIKEVQIYPHGESEMPLKSIEFNFPIYRDGKEVRKILWESGNTVESIMLLSRK